MSVRSVQNGESPEVVAGVLGINRSTMYSWLAQYRRGGWGALKSRPLFGRPPRAKHKMRSDRARVSVIHFALFSEIRIGMSARYTPIRPT